jgi:LacI family transcriptional regulator
MPTIRDVASRAGVSTATVSYVLNGTGTVTAATRARVLEAAESLRYQPNHSARALRTRAQTLGLVLPAAAERLLDEGTAELLAGLTESAAQAGFYLLLAAAADSDDELAVIDRLARSGRVDGLILLDLHIDDPRIALLTAAGLPWVAGGGDAQQQPAQVVTFDYAGGCAAALDHLARLGHDAIALIAPPSDLVVSDQLISAYLAWHEQAGLVVESGLLLEADAAVDAGYRAAQELLASEQPFSAVLVGNDMTAVGVLHALVEAQLHVPADIALISIGDLPIAGHTQPALTTLRAPRRRQGAELARRLITAVTGGKPDRSAAVLPFQLIQRASTARRSSVSPQLERA